MRIPPEQRIDALKMKDHCQAKVREELEGLTPEEQTRKIRELVENGPFGDLWRRLRSRGPAAREGRPSAARST